jgi:hypothetical protein
MHNPIFLHKYMYTTHSIFNKSIFSFVFLLNPFEIFSDMERLN